MLVKNIDDTRAITDIGSAIFVKRSGDTKYSLWLAVTNIPATGSAPDQVETTVTTSRKKTYTFGRQDTPQKEFTFMAHRDNFTILSDDYNKQLDFLQVNPDSTGWAFRGYVSFYQDEISVGANLTGKAVITVTSSEETPRTNVSDIVMESVTFTSVIPADVAVTTTGTGNIFTIKPTTDPADATITVASSSTSIATATISEGTITITGVAVGSCIVTLTATKTNLATTKTSILVTVA